MYHIDAGMRDICSNGCGVGMRLDGDGRSPGLILGGQSASNRLEPFDTLASRRNLNLVWLKMLDTSTFPFIRLDGDRLSWMTREATCSMATVVSRSGLHIGAQVVIGEEKTALKGLRNDSARLTRSPSPRPWGFVDVIPTKKRHKIKKPKQS